MMRILITGVTGQIGGALAIRLQGIGEIIEADRRKLDLSNPNSIPRALTNMAPEVIFNPAAYTQVDNAEREREMALVVNAQAPGVMASWAAERNIPFVHFSTDYVFDGTGERPWREDDCANPLSAYGLSKLAGENAVRAAGGAFLIVRTSWVYSAQGRSFLLAITRLARERRELRVVADQIGAPASAALVADAFRQILNDQRAVLPTRFAQAHGLVHLTASGETSWYHFANAIIDGLRRRGVILKVKRVLPITTHEYAAPAKRPHNSRLSLERLQQVFGVAMPDWRTALDPELDVLAKSLMSHRGSGPLPGRP
jgi:dTDP-4-dehydrorhamnose reductase